MPCVESLASRPRREPDDVIEPFTVRRLSSFDRNDRHLQVCQTGTRQMHVQLSAGLIGGVLYHDDGAVHLLVDGDAPLLGARRDGHGVIPEIGRCRLGAHPLRAVPAVDLDRCTGAFLATAVDRDQRGGPDLLANASLTVRDIDRCRRRSCPREHQRLLTGHNSVTCGHESSLAVLA